VVIDKKTKGFDGNRKIYYTKSIRFCAKFKLGIEDHEWTTMIQNLIKFRNQVLPGLKSVS